MARFFRLPSAALHNPDVDAWFEGDGPRHAVKPWFDRMRACGPDVRVLIHDGNPTACVEDAAFAYVGAYTGHGSIGFFDGAELDDPAHLLEGGGKFMRHVKLHWGKPVDEMALTALIDTAYRSLQARLPRVDGA